MVDSLIDIVSLYASLLGSFSLVDDDFLFFSRSPLDSPLTSPLSSLDSLVVVSRSLSESFVVVVNREEAVVVGETEVGGVTMEDATADVEGRAIEVIALEVRLVDVTEDAVS